MKFFFYFLIFLTNLIFFQNLSLAKSNDQFLVPFTIGFKSLENIPYKHFEYLEGYDHNVTLKELVFFIIGILKKRFLLILMD